MTHPLQFVTDGKLAETEANRAAQYEDKTVGHLLYRFHISRYKARLLMEAQRRIGKSVLSLPIFFEHFPTFPYYLTAAQIPFIERECTVRRLFNSMSTRPMIRRYEDFVDESLIPDCFIDKPLGLVFPWPHIEHGLIVHDGAVDFDTKPPVNTKPMVRMIWTLSEQKRKWMDKHQGWPTPYLTIEPFEQFLTGLAWEFSSE
jgi:hypothetical protein